MNKNQNNSIFSHLYGFTDMKTLNEKGPIILNQGKGIYVFDIYNKKYLDANSGLWNSVAGFDHPGLVETARKQYKKFGGYHSFFGRLSEETLKLSEKIISISPFKSGKVFFTNSGSEANDTAIKILWMLNNRRGKPNKRKIITRINAYHGVTLGASSMTGKPYIKEFGMPLNEFIHADCPHYWKFGLKEEKEEDFSKRMGKNLEELIIKETPETIAGFFAEPVQGAGGVIPPSKGYFDVIQPILKKYKIPFVADEVITGLGRTGNLWGTETFNLKPDIIISSKALTAGFFPMAAVILNQDIADEFIKVSEQAEEFPHGFTGGGHPVGCAIALKAIDVIMNEGLLDNVKEVSPYFLKRLKEFESYEHIGETRGIGLMAALEMVKNKELKTPFDSHLSMGDKVANESINNGLICRPLGPAIVLCPQFIITKKEIDLMFDMLHDTLKKIFKKN